MTDTDYGYISAFEHVDMSSAFRMQTAAKAAATENMQAVDSSGPIMLCTASHTVNEQKPWKPDSFARPVPVPVPAPRHILPGAFHRKTTLQRNYCNFWSLR